MRITLIVALVLHVLSGVFWAGTTFALARMRGNQADLFFRPQMGAAAIAVATGGVLWFFLHHGPLGTQGHLLAVGALCAFIALGEPEGSRLRHRVATGERIAAALLMITVTCMAAARYV